MALEKLIIEDIVEGTGPGVAAGDRISVHYTGKFEDGTVFDSSVERGEPIDFTCGVGMVIPGWDQGLIGLKKGANAAFRSPMLWPTARPAIQAPFRPRLISTLMWSLSASSDLSAHADPKAAETSTAFVWVGYCFEG